MTQQKTKISGLFFIITLCSFCTGFAVGIFATYQFMNSKEEVNTQQDVLLEPVEIKVESDEEESDDLKSIDQNETESLKRYKKMLENSLKDSTQDPDSIIYYGVLMGDYKSSDQANNLAIDLKDQFKWHIAVYPIEDSHHVIVGPFDDKEEANYFLKQLPKQARFIKARVVLFPQSN